LLHLDRDLDLRADAVGARDEDGLLRVRRGAEHSAEAAELSDDARGEGGFHETLDAPLRFVRRLDVDSRIAVVQAHISSSKATSRRNSATRSAIWRASTSSSRSMENFSTANEPI